MIVEAIKRCTNCGSDRPLSAYSRSKTGACGRTSACKECHRGYSREWAKTRRPQVQIRTARQRRAQKYGLRLEQLEALLEASGCEACGKHLGTDSDKRIDHRHSDGAVRGVLCDRCNRSLGLCDESPAVLLGICQYIQKTLAVDHRVGAPL